VFITPPRAPIPAPVETPILPEPLIPPEPPDPLPAWIRGGLVCVGCGRTTAHWQIAAPDKNQCVCKACFATGVRLQ
jgi:hypothetical protein